MEWYVELALTLLLIATLFRAVKLERALGVLKHDRTAIQDLIERFTASTQAAENGIGQLRAATDGAGRLLARQVESAQARQDDLTFLIDRAETLADRLERLVRAGRPAAPEPAPPPAQSAAPPAAAPPAAALPIAALSRPRSQAERDLLRALGIAG